MTDITTGAGAGPATATGIRTVRVTDIGYLILDKRVGAMERRDHTCQRLYPCESAWSQAHSTKQARCPMGCKQYVERLESCDAER